LPLVDGKRQALNTGEDEALCVCVCVWRRRGDVEK
jgi:hypothetical protein